MAGRYTAERGYALITGETFRSTDELLILPEGPGRAYVEVETWFFNGHSCSLSGLAKVEGDYLIVRGPANADRQCLLRLRLGSEGISMAEDEARSCTRLACGARGSFAMQFGREPDFRHTTRRAIQDADRIRATDAYKAAIAP